MQQHASKYRARKTPPTLGMGLIGQNSTFSEDGHVAYQFKGNNKCNSTVANILPADPQTLGMGSIGQ